VRAFSALICGLKQLLVTILNSNRSLRGSFEVALKLTSAHTQYWCKSPLRLAKDAVLVVYRPK